MKNESAPNRIQWNLVCCIELHLITLCIKTRHTKSPHYFCSFNINTLVRLQCKLTNQVAVVAWIRICAIMDASTSLFIIIMLFLVWLKERTCIWLCVWEKIMLFQCIEYRIANVIFQLEIGCEVRTTTEKKDAWKQETEWNIEVIVGDMLSLHLCAPWWFSVNFVFISSPSCVALHTEDEYRTYIHGRARTMTGCKIAKRPHDEQT